MAKLNKKFKVTVLNFIRPKRFSVFYIHDTNGIKSLSHRKLNFIRLNEQRFRYNFDDTVDPMRTCGLELETALYYLVSCYLYSTHNLELLDYVYVLSQSLKY